MTDKQQQAAAAQFAKEWEGRGYEKGESYEQNNRSYSHYRSYRLQIKTTTR